MQNNNSLVSKSPKWWRFGLAAWQPIAEYFKSDVIKDEDLWQQLKSGQSNTSFRLRIHNRHYFIQLPNEKNNLLRPFNGQYSALDRWLMSTQIKQWLTRHYIDLPLVCISEWIDNDPQYIRFSNQSLRQQLVGFLVGLHQLSPINGKEQNSDAAVIGESLLTKPLDMAQHLKGYFELAIKTNPQQRTAIELLYNEGLFFAKSHEPSCFCHSDLNPFNLLWDANKGQLKIIDWEYACFNDPLLDIAGLLVHWSLSSREQSQFVAAYQQRMGRSIDPQKLKDMGSLSRVLSKLWHFASDN
ncbi:MAG: phosphotransferase [Enterobacterales bacterium]|nr:phosphotransferase [Enterobacterales bacterium]